MKITRNPLAKNGTPDPVRIGIAAVVLAGLAFGGLFAANGIQSAQADERARTVAAAEASAEQKATEKAMYDAAAEAETAQEAADAAAYQQFLADKAAAEAKEAADAKAAADAQAAAEAQAAADAAAKAAKAPVKKAAGSSAGGAASGTPLPMKLETDPNNGQYGEMVIAVDPGSWCASHSGSTINGVPTCD